jgi:two-component system, OmpR family, phosphate regulon sensor histidine kinase PhoR
VRVHHPLFAGFLGVVGLLVLTLVLSVGLGLRRELLEIRSAELLRELGVAAEFIEAASGAPPDSLVGRLHGRVGYRVTLIDRDGVVLADSDVVPTRLPEVEIHLDRPEVVAALQGRTGVVERRSTTIGTGLLYAAGPVTYRGEPAVLRLAASLSEVQETVRTVQGAVAGAGVAALLLSLVVSYLLSRSLTRPLVVLSDRARALASGDFSRRAPRGHRIRELEELAGAFNRLADELQVRLAELGQERDEMQALVDCIAEGVIALTEDARILRVNPAAAALLQIPQGLQYAPVGAVLRHPELRDLLEESVLRPFRGREITVGDRHLLVSSRLLDQGGAVVTFLDVSEARRLDQVRRDFVANASHELKTPLTAVRGFAETLVDGDPPENLRKEFLESIRSNTLRLQQMVDDLLDLSRLESGGWVARPEGVELAALARQCWEEMAGEEGGAKGAGGMSFAVTGTARARADRQGLRQIFRNLFENALRYTPAGGSVGVRIEPVGGGMVLVSVSDSGSGIPSSALPRIFERFYRVDASRARPGGGTGLGLAIVRHLVQAMGGEVGAESALGEGTTIHFSIPAEAGRAAGAADGPGGRYDSVTGP